MEYNKEVKLLRIFIGESDKFGQQPLYEKIVSDAKEKGLSGATVVRGIMGFGANSIVRTTKLFEISSDLPLIIEIVDTEDNIKNFVVHVEHLFDETKSGGMITIEKAEVIRYKAGE